MNNTMRAAVLREHGERERVQIESIAVPEPGPGDVRLRVRACALNWLDVGIRRGPKFGEIRLPLIGGADISGVVDKLGPDVSEWQVGDAVIVYPLITCGLCEQCRRGELTTCPEHRIIGEHIDGGLADYCVVPAINLLAKPVNLTFVEAAAIPVVFMTAWHMLFSVGKLQIGEHVLIPGAGGGVASAGIQLAHHAGAVVYTTTSTRDKAERARALGATHVFNYRDEDWIEAVLQVTGGRGVDLIQDNVGAATWADALRTLARNGRFVTCGSHSGATVALDIGQIYHRQTRILGSNGGTHADMAAALRLIEEGQVRPVVHAVLPLDEIQEGHRLLETHEHFGKIVVEL